VYHQSVYFGSLVEGVSESMNMEEKSIQEQADELIKRRGPSDLSRHLEDILREIHRMESREAEMQLRIDQIRSTFQAQIEASRSRHGELYDSAPVGYFTLDRNGFILEVNRTGAALLGIPKGYLIKTPFALYVVEEDRPSFHDYRISLYTKGERQSCEIRLIKKDGTSFPAQMDSMVVLESDGATNCRSIVSDISERKQVEETLQEIIRQYRMIFERAPVGLARLDLEGRAIESNLALQQMLGYRSEELGRLVFTQITYPDDVAQEWSLFRELSQAQRESYQLQKRYYRRDGAVIWADLAVFLVRDRRGEAQFAIALVREISRPRLASLETKAIEEIPTEETQRIEEIREARNSFFSYISHELKTPVNSIIGFTQLLRRGTYGPLTPEQLRIMTRIHGCAEELVRLINNILDLARMESGKMVPQMIETNLPEILDRVVVSLDPLLREKELMLEKKLAPNFPQTFRTDPSFIRSVLTNLLSNAVKFTQEGTIRVELNPLAEPGGVQIIVSDTGAGIEPDRLEHIFEEYQPFSANPEASTEYTKGSGLGLSIVKKIVDALAGRISVESSPGRGTTFTIEIPEPRS